MEIMIMKINNYNNNSDNNNDNYNDNNNNENNSNKPLQWLHYFLKYEVCTVVLIT